jgi:hypothetical protein
MLDDQRWLFLDEVFLSNAISAALGHSGTYKKDGPKDADTIVGRALRSELRKTTVAYASPVAEETHTQNVRAFAQSISDSCAECLTVDGLRFGVAHKALNLYLKFLWCDKRIPIPPHCPFDGKVIGKLKLPLGSEWRWTIGTEKDYRAWVAAAKIAAGTQPLAEWELHLWNPAQQ